MSASLEHRGPDDEGIWADEDASIALIFRRLAIVDLSPMGHQPMESADGRYVIVFNGEIYNHAAIRAELDSLHHINWRGQSDTETLLEAIAQWGLHETLKRTVGMYGIALWDQRARALSLARDRFGEKPLYYGWTGGDFVFASELKAIRLHTNFNNEVDRRAVRLLAARAYIPAPLSIFEGLFKLEPGCILTVDADAIAQPSVEPPQVGNGAGPLRLERYWSYREAIIRGLASQFTHEEEALEALEAVLEQAIAVQAVADVPVGAFLSGGIDSSTVVALYQAHSPGRVKTFSMGFAEAGFDEAIYARKVAAHLSTDHHERYVTVREAQDVIPALPGIYDEPFADSSQIPTHLVARLAREQVTVALSGDGGDEMFGGYNRYVATQRLWNRLERLPRPLRVAIGGTFALAPPALWNALTALLPSGRRPAFFGTRVRKGFRTLRDAATLEDVVAGFHDEWGAQDSPVLPSGPLPAECAFDMNLGAGASAIARMMYCDAVSYLPDDILCKVDRAAMAVSLETRIPFLDHRVAAVAARIPVSMKIHGGTGKAILRRLLYKYAPQHLFERPKAGFAVPVGEWIKGPLRSWAEDLLDPQRMREGGYFDTDAVQRRWRLHLAGQQDATQALWSVLMFQAWLTR